MRLTILADGSAAPYSSCVAEFDAVGKAGTMPFTVKVCHDQSAGVWFVQETDVPGLHAEAATLDELVTIIEDVAPDLIAELPGASDIPVAIQHLVVAKRSRAA